LFEKEKKKRGSPNARLSMLDLRKAGNTVMRKTIPNLNCVPLCLCYFFFGGEREEIKGLKDKRQKKKNENCHLSLSFATLPPFVCEFSCQANKSRTKKTKSDYCRHHVPSSSSCRAQRVESGNERNKNNRKEGKKKKPNAFFLFLPHAHGRIGMRILRTNKQTNKQTIGVRCIRAS
jgi:hypothetical protein